MYKKIVLIAGVPRSGTSWLGQIIESSPAVVYRFQPLFSYAFKGYLDHDSTKKDCKKFFDAIYFSKDSFLSQNDKREKGKYPIFQKNLEPKVLAFKQNRYQYLFPKIISLFDNIKMLGIIRHPCAVINSWIQTPREFPVRADVNKEWRFAACRNLGKEEEFFGFYKWREIANLYLDLKDKFPNKIHLINYNKLVNNTLSEVKKIFNFLEIEITPQTREFIKESNAKHIEEPYAVYKNKDVKDKWKKQLDKKIIKEIYFELKGTRLASFLL